MVRVPELPGLAGTSVAGSRLFQEARRTGGFGNFLQRSTFDGVNRLVNYRAVQDYPLMVFVARANVDVLDGWFQDTFVSGAVALTVAGALGLFGWRLGRHIRLHRKAEADVRASERHYRLLADHGSDLITVLGPDGRRTYVSPASVRLLGYQPEEMLNKHPMEMAHPDDHEALAAHFAAGFRDGNAPPVTFRARHKDGRWIWLEAVARQMAEGGQVASLRDVGQRKAAEDLLQEANQRLRMMVMQDGLTGIANRRCFDEMLEQEHRRAARESVPLALLLIDVDRFKAFNDTSGHMAGDACLRRIAAELHTHPRRPADLVARYGGEEFAFLLPGTDGAGALARAETMRLAIRDLAIAHGCSPAGVVTISIGVSVIWPQPGQDLAPTLIDVADTALYRAKAAGRNRVEAGFELSGVSTSQELFAEVGAGFSTAPH